MAGFQEAGRLIIGFSRKQRFLDSAPLVKIIWETALHKILMNKKPIKILRNCQIRSITAGIPSEHQHIRTAVETEDEIIVFQEASIAALVRVYTTIKTHPIIKGVHLEGKESADTKKGYAHYQLMESNLKDDESISLLDDILNSEE